MGETTIGSVGPHAGAMAHGSHAGAGAHGSAYTTGAGWAVTAEPRNSQSHILQPPAAAITIPNVVRTSSFFMLLFSRRKCAHSVAVQWTKQLYTTPDDVQTQRADFFHPPQPPFFRFSEKGGTVYFGPRPRPRKHPSRRSTLMNRTLGTASRVKALLAAAIAIWSAAPAVRSAPPSPQPSPIGTASKAEDPQSHEGSLWLIDTRGLAGCDPAREGAPKYWRCGPGGKWTAANLKAFLDADDPAIPTAVFLHGNRVDPGEAVGLGSNVYAVLKAEAQGRPFRFVIWSWPSERIRGPVRRSVQIKAARSELESYYLADCIRQIQPKVRISLIGHSFGARAVGGALHLLAGEEFAGRRLPGPAPQRAPLRVVLVAAAMDNTSLLPNGSSGLPLKSVDRLLVTCNPADRVLRWYPRMERGRPHALGYTGPAWLSLLGPDSQKLELLNLSPEVGRRHKWKCYLAACSLRARLGWYAFLDRPEPPSASIARGALSGVTPPPVTPLARAAVHGSPLSALLAHSAPGPGPARPQQ